MSAQAGSAVQDRQRGHAGDLADAPAITAAGEAAGAAPRATVEVTRVYHFSSAHRLSSPALASPTR